MLGISYPRDHLITHKIIKALDIPTYKMAPHFEEAYQFIKQGLQEGNVLVHCAAGISRVRCGLCSRLPWCSFT
jgi:protein-tyrosine phosphatase